MANHRKWQQPIQNNNNKQNSKTNKNQQTQIKIIMTTSKQQ